MIAGLRLVFLALVFNAYAERSNRKVNWKQSKGSSEKGALSFESSRTGQDFGDKKFLTKGARKFRGTSSINTGWKKNHGEAQFKHNKKMVRRSFHSLEGDFKRNAWSSAQRKENGSWCKIDKDCISDRCGTWFSCIDKNELGHSCAEDGQCKSDRCGSLFTCVSKNEIGEGCVEDGACKSDRCGSWFTCIDRNKVGESCFEDGQCETSMCLRLVCSKKVKYGGYCEWDRHCESHHCGIDYKCGYDYNQFEAKTRGSCGAGSPPGEIKIMTYNVFALNCILAVKMTEGLTQFLIDTFEGTFLEGSVEGSKMPCQEGVKKEKRLKAIPKYFQGLTNSPDVVIMQELFDEWEEIRDGMIQAGYCHYMTTTNSNWGCGMAVYSKYEIKKTDFEDWFDNRGGKRTGQAEAWADKGVMYTKIRKDGKNYNIFNTHTQSNSVGDGHPMRMYQFGVINKLVEKLHIPTNEMVLIGGDLNEDKFSEEHSNYFEEMLNKMNVAEPNQIVNNENPKYSYNTEENAFLKTFWPDDDENYKEFLDVVLYKKNYLQPGSSSCKIVKPKHPDGSEGNNLSDHYGNVCTFK